MLARTPPDADFEAAAPAATGLGDGTVDLFVLRHAWDGPPGLAAAVAEARRVLAPGGVFVTKVFQGEGFDELMRESRTSFGRVLTRKPKASRPRSREVYLVATGYRGDEREIGTTP